MKRLLAQVAPGGKYEPAKANEYVQKFKAVVVTDPAATFEVTAKYDGQRIRLSGETSDRKYHDPLIDLFVGMKLYDLTNDIKVPPKKDK
jgi:hypothetical protein